MNVLRKTNQSSIIVIIIFLITLNLCTVSLPLVIGSSNSEEIKQLLIDNNVTPNNITKREESLTQDVNKIRINEIKYETQEFRVEWAGDEYIELLVIEGGFDPSYWYVTDWDNDNYWEIPASCPTVSSNEFIVIHLGAGINDNDGPFYHYYMNEYTEKLANQGESLTLFEDNDSEHNRGGDIAHDFVVYGIFSEREVIENAWCGWSNREDTATDSIFWTGNRYESLQLFGDDFDNSSNWFSAKITPGRDNVLFNCYIEDFVGLESEIYCNITATNASGWGSGRIQIAENIGSPSVAQSVCCYSTKGGIHNVTLFANQTIFPNSSIHYQISINSKQWEPINLNETYSYLDCFSQTLYWRAKLETEVPEESSPWIDSIRIELGISYDTKPPIIKVIDRLNNSVIFPGTIIKCAFEDQHYVKSWVAWDDGSNLILTDPWIIICPPLEEGYHWLVISANDSIGYESRKQYLFFIDTPPHICLITNTSIITLTTNIEFNITDHVLTRAWYQWDNQTKIPLSSPFSVRAIDSPGEHTLWIEAKDNWDNTTIKNYSFIILSPATIDASLLSSNIYVNESFTYSLTVMNLELIPLKLTLLTLSTYNDVLRGNGSQLHLNPREEYSITLEIRPKRTGRHQLEIYLLYEDLIYYYEVLELIVWPQWLSPNFLLEFRIYLVLLLGIVVSFGSSIYYMRKHIVINRLYWKQYDKLFWLINQLTISNLEIRVKTEKKRDISEEHSPIPPGFPQHLLIPEALDREALEHQFQSLREEIIYGDPKVYQKLSKLLTQAEELLSEYSKEDNNNP